MWLENLAEIVVGIFRWHMRVDGIEDVDKVLICNGFKG